MTHKDEISDEIVGKSKRNYTKMISRKKIVMKTQENQERSSVHFSKDNMLYTYKKNNILCELRLPTKSFCSRLAPQF